MFATQDDSATGITTIRHLVVRFTAYDHDKAPALDAAVQFQKPRVARSVYCQWPKHRALHTQLRKQFPRGQVYLVVGFANRRSNVVNSFSPLLVTLQQLRVLPPRPEPLICDALRNRLLSLLRSEGSLAAELADAIEYRILRSTICFSDALPNGQAGRKLRTSRLALNNRNSKTSGNRPPDNSEQ